MGLLFPVLLLAQATRAMFSKMKDAKVLQSPSDIVVRISDGEQNHIDAKRFKYEEIAKKKLRVSIKFKFQISSTIFNLLYVNEKE